MSAPPRSQLLEGTVRHRRHEPREHSFRYGLYHVLLDLDELDELDERLTGFGYNRAAILSFHDRDHLDDTDESVRSKLQRWLERQGRELPGGPVRLWTNLRVLGYVFNPVSFYFCHAPAGELEMIVAEVNNTFGERYCYLLDDLRRERGSLRASRSKRLHVSPFLPIEGLDYRFAFRPPEGGARVVVHMDVHDEDGRRVFDATLAEDPQPLTTTSLWRAVLRHPLVTMMTIVRIHWQAVKLGLKRTPFYRKPSSPPNDLNGPHPAERSRDREMERAS